MKAFDLSLRYKVPIWGGILIVVTALTVTGFLLNESYKEIHEDLQISVKVLGQSLLFSLFPVLLERDYARVKAIISEPLNSSAASELDFVEEVLVVDPQLRVYASAQYDQDAQPTTLAAINQEYAQLESYLQQLKSGSTRIISHDNSRFIYFLFPIARDTQNLGTLVIVSDTRFVLPRFYFIALHGLLAGGLILAILLPLNWYWAQHMTIPLVELTERMESLSSHAPARDLEANLYHHQDELGKLFQAYNQMVQEMKSKAELERQMVKAERLAALGQLAAGVAHEINNPLGGMLTAIDTLKCHSRIDPRTIKTITLIERGLAQIRDTVSALLVEGRLKSRPLTPQDLQDIRTLISPQLTKKHIHLNWEIAIEEDIQLPATLVRQVMINLLLNAVQAAEYEGEVGLKTWLSGNLFQLKVVNGGRMLTEEQMSHLFEPFSSLSQNSHGLGLWVTYQIVNQLNGHVWAVYEDKKIAFNVTLPLGVST